MKFVKELLYIFAFVALIILIMAVFRDSLGLAPHKNKSGFGERERERNYVIRAELNSWIEDNFGKPTADRNADKLLREMGKYADRGK